MEHVNNNSSSIFTKEEMESGKAMAILSYIIPLIPYFAEKNNKWVRFHAVQGMNLLIVAIAVNILTSVLFSMLWSISWRLWGILSTLSSVVNIGIAVLCVIGIVNVCQEKAKELPLISKVKIFKK